MQTRISMGQVPAAHYKAVMALEQTIQDSGLDKSLVHLLKLRASQINGCAFCVDMHTKEARKDGLGEQWINLICTWRESPIYDERERAVLGWTESVTNIALTGAANPEYEALKAHFTAEQIATLTIAIATINVWNRMAIAFRFIHPVDAKAKAAA